MLLLVPVKLSVAINGGIGQTQLTTYLQSFAFGGPDPHTSEERGTEGNVGRMGGTAGQGKLVTVTSETGSALGTRSELTIGESNAVGLEQRDISITRIRRCELIWGDHSTCNQEAALDRASRGSNGAWDQERTHRVVGRTERKLDPNSQRLGDVQSLPSESPKRVVHNVRRQKRCILVRNVES